MAKAIKQVFADCGAGDRLVFKSSFDKANRTAGATFRGPRRGCDPVWGIGEERLPIITDIHEPDPCPIAAEVGPPPDPGVPLPADGPHRCRRRDEEGREHEVRPVLAPDDCSQIVAKCRAAGNTNVLLTERGTTFGYHNLVVDFRGLPMMRSLGAPVIYDATHSLQLPGGFGTETGGSREYAPALARAAAAVGVDGYFFEVHDDPAHAKSDRATQLPLEILPKFLSDVLNSTP